MPLSCGQYIEPRALDKTSSDTTQESLAQGDERSLNVTKIRTHIPKIRTHLKQSSITDFRRTVIINADLSSFNS